ncbi:MAG: flagellar motor switch protein FliG [Rhodobacteraceae bacterium]|nr:flagellar motor switch protein FliG [Paracoccaceae bacterium]
MQDNSPFPPGADAGPVPNPPSALPAGHAQARHDPPPLDCAAIVLRLLLDRGAAPDISHLDPALQLRLLQRMSRLQEIDAATRDAAIARFRAALADLGAAFPGDLDALIADLGPRISSDVARTARQAAARGATDPWARIAARPVPEIAATLASEAPAIAAIALSCLPAGRAAEVLEAMTPPAAAAIARAFPSTSATPPEALGAVGAAVLAALDARPRRAFERAATARIGAVLNVAGSELRNHLMERIEADSEEMAAAVRKVLFSFADIPDRLSPRDVARLVREVEQPILVTALAGAEMTCPDAVAFVLGALSTRRADQFREEITDLGVVPPRKAEEAQRVVIQAIRTLTDAGEIEMIEPE